MPLLVSVCLVGLSFPNLFVPAAVYGLACAGRHSFVSSARSTGGTAQLSLLTQQRHAGVPAVTRRAMAAAAVVHACFVFRYDIVDLQMFFLPLYVLLSVFAGIGFAAVERWTVRRGRRIEQSDGARSSGLAVHTVSRE